MDNGASSYRRFLEGDESGLEDIIKYYKDGLILYLLGYTKNIYVAEEIMEETFVKLVVKKPRFSEKYSFKTWLYTIGRNAAIDYFRKNSRIIPVPACDLAKIKSDEEDIEKSYIKEERKIAVHRTINKLYENYRQVLYLSFFEGMSNGEIAAVMKKNKRQVENLIYRAKQALKTELEKGDFIYEEL